MKHFRKVLSALLHIHKVTDAHDRYSVAVTDKGRESICPSHSDTTANCHAQRLQSGVSGHELISIHLLDLAPYWCAGSFHTVPEVKFKGIETLSAMVLLSRFSPATCTVRSWKPIHVPQIGK